MTSAPVTDWPLRLLLVALVLGVIALVLLAMLRGWRARGRRQASIPEPPAIPEGLAIPEEEAPGSSLIPGVYLGSVRSGDWLDRIVAHGLGTRSRVELSMHPEGLAVERLGARQFFIPSSDLRDARRDRGIAGKAFEKDAVVVITWSLGEELIDTGIRPDRAEDAQALIDGIHGLLHTGGSDTTRPSPPGMEPGL